MIFGLIALALAAAFAGAAFYINVAEHPARMALDDAPLLAQWKPSYAAGFTMQASLAVASFLCAAAATWQTGDWRWMIGGVLIVANWPFTMIVIMPTNDRLKSIANGDAGPTSRALLVAWAKLHAVRTVLGIAATIVFLVIAVT